MMNKINWGMAIFILLLIGLPSLFYLNGRLTSPAPSATVSATFETLVYPESLTVLQWDQVLVDTGLFDPNNPSRLTAPKRCLYLIIAQISWSSPYGAPTYLSVVKNGITRIGMVEDSESPSISVVHPLITNEFVELNVYIAGEAGMRILSIQDQSPIFSMTCIGDMGNMDYPNPQ